MLFTFDHRLGGILTAMQMPLFVSHTQLTLPGFMTSKCPIKLCWISHNFLKLSYKVKCQFYYHNLCIWMDLLLLITHSRVFRPKPQPRMSNATYTLSQVSLWQITEDRWEDKMYSHKNAKFYTKAKCSYKNCDRGFRTKRKDLKYSAVLCYRVALVLGI